MTESNINHLATFCTEHYCRDSAFSVMEHAEEILECGAICSMLEKWHELNDDNRQYRVQSLIDYAKSGSEYWHDCCKTNYEYYCNDDMDELNGYAHAIRDAIEFVIED